MTGHDELIAAYLTGAASTEEVRRLEEILRADAAARQRFVDLCREDLALRQVLLQDEWEEASVAAGRPVTEAHRRRPADRHHRSGTGRRVHGGTGRHQRRADRQRRRPKTPLLLPLAACAAAAVLLVGVAVLLATRDGGRPEATGPGPAVARTGGPEAPPPADPAVARVEQGAARLATGVLAEGDGLAAGVDAASGDATLHLRCLADGSLIRLPPGSRVAFAAAGDGCELRLLAGYAYAEVTEQAPGRSFRILTPHGRIEALGTVIIANAAPERSVAAVMEGRIAITAEDGERRELTRGHHLRLADGGFDSDPDRPVAFTLTHGGSGLPLPGRENLRGTASVSLSELDERGLNVLVDLPDAATSMRAYLDGREGPIKLEQHWPFFAFGNTLEMVGGKRLDVGVHRIRVVLYRDFQGTDPLGVEATLILTVNE